MMFVQTRWIAVLAGKGGVGKTTSVINVGAALAAMGSRCLMVDCDPQSNLTSGLGLDPYAPRRTLSDVIVGRCDAAEAVVATGTPGLRLLPAHPDLSAVEAELPTRIDSVLRLRRALHPSMDSAYDVVLFDTPPNFGFHTLSALASVRYALVPLQMSAFAVRALKEVLRVLAAARRSLNPELELLGVAPTFVDRTRFSRDILDALESTARVRVFRSQIPMSVTLQESALRGVPVLVSAPSCSAAHAYRTLATEIAEAVHLTPSVAPAAPPLEGVASARRRSPRARTAESLEVAPVSRQAPVAIPEEKPAGSSPGTAPTPAASDDLDWPTVLRFVRVQLAATGRQAASRGLGLRVFRRRPPAA